jgi:hypothetical protein
MDAGVIQVPQFGPLRLRVPLAELVPERKDALLGARLFLVAAGAADAGVELVQGDGFESVCGLRRRTVPRLIESSTEPTISRSPSSATRLSRKVMTSSKLWPVSICTSGNGKRPGRKAFSARRSMTTESLPPENSSAGLLHSAATSRMMWIASDSSQSRWRLAAELVRNCSTAVFMMSTDLAYAVFMRFV